MIVSMDFQEKKMLSARVYVCIATEEPMPNILAAMQLKPEKAYIVCSGHRKIIEKAGRLAEVMKYFGIEAVLIHGMPSSGYDGIRGFLEKQMEAICSSNPDGNFSFNITGGTKLMSLALGRVADTVPNASVYYVDTAAGQIECLKPEQTPAQPLDNNLLPARAILMLHGFVPENIESEQPDWIRAAQDRSQMTQLMGDNMGKGGIFSFVNLMNRCYFELHETQKPHSKNVLNLGKVFRCERELSDLLRRLFEMAARHELMEFEPETREFRFLSEDAVKYFGGRWLEEYMWLKVKNDPTLEVAAGVSGRWFSQTEADGQQVIMDGSNTHNEIDLLVIRNNIVHIVECKTGAYTRANRSKETLEEIATLKQHTGGRLAKGYLATLKDLTPSELERARQLDVQVFEANEIKELISILRH
jgi:Holliday junction resolvase